MHFADIGQLYLSKEKYSQELDESSAYFKRLLIETVEWKIPHLMQVVPPTFVPETVAEIGCFAGHLIGNILINGKGNFYRFGYDVNPQAIAVAQKLYANTEFSCSNALISGKHYDLLILSDIVEHIEDDLNFMVSCKQLSKYVLLNLPLEKSISNSRRKYGFDDTSGHLRAYSLQEALRLIAKSGYKIQVMQTVCIVNSFFYQKRMSLLYQGYPQRPIFSLKSLGGQLLRQSSWFNQLYYGANLFAFLESE